MHRRCSRQPQNNGAEADIEVFTTRPDTLFGATYLVLAPEHDLVDELVAIAWPDGTDPRWTYGAATPVEAVAAYRRAIAAKSDLERQENKEKTGVFLGSYADQSGQRANRCRSSSPTTCWPGTARARSWPSPATTSATGTSPAQFGLPIVEVIAGGDISQAAYAGDGGLVNSDYLDGMDVAAAKQAITARLEAEGHGEGTHRIQAAGLAFRPAAVLG